MREVCFGLLIGAQSSLYPIANMTIQSKINAFGINSIAAWAVCGKLDFLIWLTMDSFGSAISTFVAQNFGARLYGMSLAIVFTTSTVLYLGSGFLGRLFVDDEKVIAQSTLPGSGARGLRRSQGYTGSCK